MNEAELAKLLSRQVGNGGVVNIVAGVRSVDGALNLAAASGMADPDTKSPLKRDTPYLLASVVWFIIHSNHPDF